MLKSKTIAILYILCFTGCAETAIQKDVYHPPIVSQYKYLSYTPGDYDQNKKRLWPLIIYLHGKSLCGNDLNRLKKYGIPYFIDQGMQFKAIVVSPQCPKGKDWTSENWFESLFGEVCQRYHIDTTRIYLTGMSMGGFGAWDLAIKYPNRFAAVVPLCGGGKPQNVCVIRNVPIWVFHGDRDKQVPIARSAEMVEALKRCGGSPKFTVLKGQGHDIHRIYENETIYRWMYMQQKSH
jgi:predicted peptidase